MKLITACILATSLAGCAHGGKQLSNRQVIIGASVAVGVAVLVILAVDQCHKGANFCDDEPR